MKLYKYVTLDILNKIIDGYIRFTPPGKFNDPFEMPAIMAWEAREQFAGLSGLVKQTEEIMDGLMSLSIPKVAMTPPINYFKGTGTSEAKEQNLSEKELQVQILNRIDEIDSTFGILSLTKTKENLLMWAHYADDHRGAVIEFEFDDIFLYWNDPDRKFAKQVEYLNDRAKIPVNEDVLMEHFFTKSPEWKYEEEFRIIRHLNHADKIADDIHLFELPPQYIRHIYFGVRSEPQKTATTAHIAKEHKFKPINCSKARLDPSHFKLLFNPIQLGEEFF
jgi:hypothetical protein